MILFLIPNGCTIYSWKNWIIVSAVEPFVVLPNDHVSVSTKECRLPHGAGLMCPNRNYTNGAKMKKYVQKVRMELGTVQSMLKTHFIKINHHVGQKRGNNFCIWKNGVKWNLIIKNEILLNFLHN